MQWPRNILKQLYFAFGLPEVQLFWILVPILIGIFILAAFDPPVANWVKILVVGGLLTAVGGVVFLASYRLARASFETKVERSELTGIIEAINDALILYDQDFRVLVFNPAAEKLFAVKAEQIVGSEIRPQVAEQPGMRLLAQVIYPSLAPTLVYRSRAGAYPQIVDLSFSDPLRELRVTTSPMIDEKGKTVAFLKVIADRTQEAALLKSKNEFVTIASHQLRTPVTEVHWALDTLAADTSIPETPRALVVQTNASVKKILNIVEDLLNVAKIEEGHFGYELQQADLVQFVESVLGVTLAQIERTGLKLYFDRPPEPLPHVAIDPQKMTMVLGNMIDNAVRYNVQSGQIVVRIRRADDPRFAEVSVKDSGIGVPGEEMKHMFEKFFRGTNAVKVHTDGSGLGLWIARSVVRAHGGEMWAESELNRGTTFFFTLPIDPTIMPSSEGANMPVA